MSFRYNDWMSYSIDGVEFGDKTKNDSTFVLNIKKPIETEIKYKDALYRNAQLLREVYKEPYDVCFSGGIDSEVVIRINKELGIKQNVIIFKFENDHNVVDVTNAINFCQKADLEYKIIDFNLENFFEHDALYYADKLKSIKAGYLPRCKWIDMLDNIPVFGLGEPTFRRLLKEDYKQKSDWIWDIWEIEYDQSRYCKMVDRIAINEWYQFTPEVLYGFLKTDIIQRLINDRIPGKLSSWSSRASVHNTFFWNMEFIPKLTGYEGRGTPGSYPQFMIDFQKQELSKYNNTDCCIPVTEFVSRITGK